MYRTCARKKGGGPPPTREARGGPPGCARRGRRRGRALASSAGASARTGRAVADTSASAPAGTLPRADTTSPRAPSPRPRAPAGTPRRRRWAAHSGNRTSRPVGSLVGLLLPAQGRVQGGALLARRQPIARPARRVRVRAAEVIEQGALRHPCRQRGEPVGDAALTARVKRAAGRLAALDHLDRARCLRGPLVP